jgi:hypothetical protein
MEDDMRKLILAVALIASTGAMADDYIGSLSSNRFAPDGINNPWSKWNNCFYPDSPCNRFGPYGNRFSPYSGRNQFSPYGPRVYGGPFNDDSDNSAELQRQIDELKAAQTDAEDMMLLQQLQNQIDTDNREYEMMLMQESMQ